MYRAVVFLALVSFCLFSVSCWRSTEEQPHIAQHPATPVPPAIVALDPLPEKPDFELQQQIEKIADDAAGEVGVGALMLETGDAAWLNRDKRFASQSVYKLPIAMTVLRMIDEGKTGLDRDLIIRPDDYVRRGFHSPIRNLNPQGTVMPLGEIVRYSISESDGTASDVLLDLAGGPSAVQQYLNSIGIKDFIVADSEKSISKDWETQFRNYTTPQASIDLLRAIEQGRAGLGESMTNVLLRVMTDSETGRRRLKRGIPDQASLAHKTGTGGTRAEIPRSRDEIGSNDPAPTPTPKAKAGTKPTPSPDRAGGPVTSATNDIGIITLPDGRHILIAVYIQNSSADTWTREKVIADIARAVCDRWYGTIEPTPANQIVRTARQ